MNFRLGVQPMLRAAISLLFVIVVFSCSKDDGPNENNNPQPSNIVPLPLVTINTNGATIVDEPKVNGTMNLLDADGVVQYDGRIAIEIRGASSQFFYDKDQYGLETRDANNIDLDVAFLSFPEEEDWILNAPYGDKSLVRNHLIYELATEMGHYASRSELVELNLNGSYDGLYVLMEKLKRDKNRIDISTMLPEEITGPALTGGYVIKIDKSEGENETVYNPLTSFESSISPLGSTMEQTIHFLYNYPKPEFIAPEQKAYISNYIADFEEALASETFTDSIVGYANYIDVDSFIDFFILNELSNNVDGYRLSTYLHKDRGEKLKAGPIWDFNLAFGNADYCEGGETNVWAYKFNERCPLDFWQVPFWWDRFLQDPTYVEKLKSRWSMLRGSTLANAYIMDKVDGYVMQINDAEAAAKNFNRWPILGIYVWPNNFIGNTHGAEVNYLKDWIEDRLLWLDGEINAL